MSSPDKILKTQVIIRESANGFVCLYNSSEYVFSNIKDLNAWLTKISVSG